AEVWYRSQVALPLSVVQQAWTGASVRRVYLRFGAWALHVWGWKQADYPRQVTVSDERDLRVFGLRLPVGWQSDEIREVEPRRFALTESAARKEALAVLESLTREGEQTRDRIIAQAREEAQARSLALTLSISTNGLRLDAEARQFLLQQGFWVSISMDGDRDTHDRFRRSPGGQPSFERVAANARRLLEAAPDRVSAATTVTRSNTDLAQIARSLYELGFTNVSLHPVNPAGPDFRAQPHRPYALKEEDWRALEEAFPRLALFALDCAGRDRPLRVHELLAPIAALEAGTRSASCGAGRAILGVSPGGDVYPCARFIGLDRLRLGRVRGGGAGRGEGPASACGSRRRWACSPACRKTGAGGCLASCRPGSRRVTSPPTPSPRRAGTAAS
ncbi:MAG: sporulation protein YqfD, partial [Acetobacteraceae bacterium]|nr:sporulation protein YqfD [Acetobacteraceae bacterium]